MTVPSVVQTNPITPFPPELNEALRKARENGRFLVCVFTENDDGTVKLFQNRTKFSDGAHLAAYRLFVGELLKIDTPKAIAEQPE